MKELGDASDELHAEVGRYARAGRHRTIARGRARARASRWKRSAAARAWFADLDALIREAEGATDRRRRGAHQRLAGESAGAGVGRALRLAGDYQRPLMRERTARMLLYLTKQLALLEGAFRVFQYLTLRAILAALTAL